MRAALSHLEEHMNDDIDWIIAVHEAAHAVMCIRGGGVLKSIRLYETETLKDGENGGLTSLASHPLGRRAYAEYAVAGHFATIAWADFDSTDASRTDFYLLMTTSNMGIVAAQKAWAAAIRRLAQLARRDPSFKAQVEGVAFALCAKRLLTGDEVIDLMKHAKAVADAIEGAIATTAAAGA